MDKQYSCYCGLYCGNCAVKATIEPLGKALRKEMKQMGFEEFIDQIPNGSAFWAFLNDMDEHGVCVSCRDGSGYPACPIRICAREKGVDMCALCASYPCAHFDELFQCNPSLRDDNELLRGQGMKAWAALQDKRRAKGFTYTADKKTE